MQHHFKWLWFQEHNSRAWMHNQRDQRARNWEAQLHSHRWRNFTAEITRIDPTLPPDPTDGTAEWPVLDTLMAGPETNTLGASWYDKGCTLMVNYGLRGIPPVGSTTMMMPLNGGEPIVCLGTTLANTQWRDAWPQIAEGEVAVWSIYGQVIRLDNEGSVTITTAANASVTISPDGHITLTPAPGKELRLAGDGASPRVVRVGDAVTAEATMAAWMTAITTAVNSGAPPSVPIVPPSGFGVCLDGSTKVRCG